MRRTNTHRQISYGYIGVSSYVSHLDYTYVVVYWGRKVILSTLLDSDTKVLTMVLTIPTLRRYRSTGTTMDVEGRSERGARGTWRDMQICKTGTRRMAFMRCKLNGQVRFDLVPPPPPPVKYLLVYLHPLGNPYVAACFRVYRTSLVRWHK